MIDRHNAEHYPDPTPATAMEHMSAAEYRARSVQKANKYGAKRTCVDGIWFDSAGEARRWSELVLLEKAGTIHKLQRQAKITLSPRVTWKMDFVYVEGGLLVYEDFKGVRYRDYVVKKNLLHDQIDAGKCVIYREYTCDGVSDEIRPKCKGCTRYCDLARRGGD